MMLLKQSKINCCRCLEKKVLPEREMTSTYENLC